MVYPKGKANGKIKDIFNSLSSFTQTHNIYDIRLFTNNYWLETNFQKYIEPTTEYFIGGNNYIYVKDPNNNFVLLVIEGKFNSQLLYCFVHKDSDTQYRLTPWRK
jgi:hypothetical protein